MTRRLRRLLIVATCPLSLGCHGSNDSFPLSSDVELRYAITRDLGVDTVSRYVDGTVTVDGQAYTALATRWPDGSVTRMLYRRGQEGMYSRSDGAGASAVEALLVPNDLTPGQTWMMAVGGGQTAVATVGEAEPFMTPAGRYSNCHRIAWSETGNANFVLLCPGIGVVKARYGPNEELLISSGPRRSAEAALDAGAQRMSETSAACANDRQSNAHISWTGSDWKLVLPADLLKDLAEYKPGFVPAQANAFPPDARDSLDRWYPAGTRDCASPYAVLADFNQDGVVDAAIFGSRGEEGMIVTALSSVTGWEFTDLDRGQASGSGWRMALVPQGTALPPGPGTPARMPKMGFVVNGLLWGPTYYYANGLKWESVASPGD